MMAFRIRSGQRRNMQASQQTAKKTQLGKVDEQFDDMEKNFVGYMNFIIHSKTRKKSETNQNKYQFTTNYRSHCKIN